MNDKRYYWLKLEENYFDLKVQKALRKLPSGADMLICYLKMQLKYLNKGGLIEYQGIYDNLIEEISLDIDEDIDIVKMTIAILIKWNVIEEENDNLYLSEMQNRIGSKTDSAIRVAKHREKMKMLHCNNDVTKCNSIQDIEKDKDIEKDIDIDNIYDFVEKNFGRTLTPIEYEEISKWEDNELTRYAIKNAVLNNAYNIKYINKILHNYKMKSIQTVQQAKLDDEQFEKRKNFKYEMSTKWLDKEIEEERATDEEIKEIEEKLNRR